MLDYILAGLEVAFRPSRLVTVVARGLLTGPISLAALAAGVLCVAARGLAGGALLRRGLVVGDLLGRRLLGHLIRGLAGGGDRRAHLSVLYPYPE